MKLEHEPLHIDDANQEVTLMPKKLLQCVATEVVLNRGSDAIAESGLATDIKYSPEKGAFTRNVICTACFEGCQLMLDSSRKVIEADIPKCVFALDLVTPSRNYEIASVIPVTD